MEIKACKLLFYFYCTFYTNHLVNCSMNWTLHSGNNNSHLSTSFPNFSAEWYSRSLWLSTTSSVDEGLWTRWYIKRNCHKRIVMAYVKNACAISANSPDLLSNGIAAASQIAFSMQAFPLPIPSLIKICHIIIVQYITGICWAFIPWSLTEIRRFVHFSSWKP